MGIRRNKEPLSETIEIESVPTQSSKNQKVAPLPNPPSDEFMEVKRRLFTFCDSQDRKEVLDRVFPLPKDVPIRSYAGEQKAYRDIAASPQLIKKFSAEIDAVLKEKSQRIKTKTEKRNE